MTEEASPPKYDADRLVRVYVKIRDAKAALKQEFDDAYGKLSEQMDSVEGELLNLCKSTGQDGGRTDHGTFTGSRCTASSRSTTRSNCLSSAYPKGT